jgi:hypothetical protein
MEAVAHRMVLSRLLEDVIFVEGLDLNFEHS